jgi:hypothetical protein
MGGASVLLALQMGLRTETAVSIAARLLGVLRGFAHHLGLPARARAAFIRQVERDVGMQIARLDVTGYQLDCRACGACLMTPWWQGESQVIHKAWFDSRLLLLEEGGHSACWPTRGWVRRARIAGRAAAGASKRLTGSRGWTFPHQPLLNSLFPPRKRT